MRRRGRIARARSVTRYVTKSKRSRPKSSGSSVMNVLLAGAIYGAARPMVANMLPTFFAFGPVDSDNVILGSAGYFMSKNSNNLIKTIGLVSMATEASIVTSRLVSGAPMSSSGSSLPSIY